MSQIDIKKLVLSQRSLYASNETKDISFRIEQLKKLKAVLRSNEALLYQAMKDDMSKSEFETYATELALIYHEINLAINSVKRWSTKKLVHTGLANFPARSYIIQEPLGCTLVIGAWNYPLQLSIVPMVSAMAAGNTCILKPSEIASASSTVMASLINENFPAEYIQVVEGGIPETTELLKHRYDKIFFTGSTSVGKIIYKAAAESFSPVTLELGGKSPCIVLADANIKMTAKRLVWSKCLNAGQTCVAPDYILAERPIYEKLIDALKLELTNYPNTELGDSEHYLQIINERNFDRLTSLMDPAKICHGGHHDRASRFIAPTLMRDVSFDDAIMQEEVFGPILPLMPMDDLDQAIQEIKSLPSPLSLYVYGKSKQRIEKVLGEIPFGGGAVNDSAMHLSNSNLPFGGIGMSGMGAYHGKTGFDCFTHQKSILHKPFWFESSVKYPKYSDMKKKLIGWLVE